MDSLVPGETVSGDELAHVIGVGKRRIEQLVGEGAVKRAGRARYALDASLVAYATFQILNAQRRITFAVADRLSSSKGKALKAAFQKHEAAVAGAIGRQGPFDAAVVTGLQSFDNLVPMVMQLAAGDQKFKLACDAERINLANVFRQIVARASAAGIDIGSGGLSHAETQPPGVEKETPGRSG